ncbi:uncharacterized protein LOC116193097 isoform X2 [Punica granatum]|uniref:Uncharacterized protein LOC116193097 isoform X2 n=1 Tax=Punica granatum TaxID=22663 RepID=A0A6P8C5P0_PUNGR|nr:uncharacterized protein LOC116193097 isoform X2 [Punica granatum]
MVGGLVITSSLLMNWSRAIRGIVSLPVNGSMQGYIEGSKGLIQGDHLSPYLFVMAIEVLSKMLDSAAQEGKIADHPLCSKIHLTHLGFAYDLVIFLKGDVDSLKVVMNIFDSFYEISSLKLNPSKSELFCAGMDEVKVQEISSINGFKRGTFPVKYLGVPLISGRLSDKDCRPFMEKIASRIESWATQKLSYAGG